MFTLFKQVGSKKAIVPLEGKDLVLNKGSKGGGGGGGVRES